MLTALFQRPHHVRRFRANPLGSLFDPLVTYLLQRGHTTSVIHQFLRAAEHFGFWLGTQHGAVTAKQVTGAAVRQFLTEHLPVCSCTARFPRHLITARAVLNHLLRLLAAQDPARTVTSPTPHDALLAGYDHFLGQTCGLSEHTRIYRLRNARTFLQRHCGASALEPSHLRPADLQDHFRLYAGHLKPGSVAVLASSLRSFLRFLALAYGADPALAEAVPSAPQWPLDRLPRALSDEDLRVILAHFDSHAAAGRRDLAMIRLMSDLGLRVSEVVGLTLDDIDWRLGILMVRVDKSRRGRTLPLPVPLGRALAAYLRDGRPASADRHLFLRHSVLAGTPLTHDLVRGVFRRAFAKATGRCESVGTHVLRHTAAVRMRAAGHSLKGIADVLGHASVDTAAIYVKLDVEALRDAALPWPGGDA